MSTKDDNPQRCIDCGQDAYIRLAGTDGYVCAHCFADRGRAVSRQAAEPPVAATTSPSRPTGSAGGAAR